MCCALYNLCCFRETFRISSSKSHTQEPVSFPIVHRFHVPPPTLQEAISPASRPAPRPAFSAPKQSTDNLDQASSTAPKRPSFNRPQLSKKTFRPERPQSLKKPQGPEDEEPSTGFSGVNRPDDDNDKPKTRPKFGFLANRKALEERRKLESQGQPDSQVKVTRRPATADIRQEALTHEVMVAESQGPRRLDASINPMVTRKRIKQPGETRQEARNVQVRKIEVTPAREGRTLGVGRSITRPSVQQTSARAQSVVVAGQEDPPRPAARRPSQTPAPPVTEATPKVTVKEIVGATVAAAKTPEPMKESESTLIEQEASSPAETIISVVKQPQETDAAIAPTGEKSSMPKEDQASEPSQQEEAMEKKMEASAGEMEEGTKPEMMKDEKSAPETPEKAAFAPPEIEVNIPKEPKEATAPQAGAAAVEEPARTRGGSSRSRSSARDQPSTTEAAQTQGRSRSRGRGTSRTASQPVVEETEAPPTSNRRSRTRG